MALNRSLRSRPETLSQLIAIAAIQLQAGVIRKTGIIVPGWRSELKLSDLRDEFLTAAERETWWASKMMRDVVEVHGKSVLRPQHGVLEFPPRHWYGVQISERGCALTRALMESDGCSLNSGAFEERVFGSTALMSLVFQYDVELWKRLIVASVHLELSENLMAIREQREAMGRWPTNLPDGNLSRVCASEKFRYQLLPDDGVRIALEPPLPETNPAAFHLSSEYRGR